jgi:peptide/nickel transport system ATP-binding protein
MTLPVIKARNLAIDYHIEKQWLNAVWDIDLAINPLQIHGLVGESGSGKSTLGLGMMRYLNGNARISNGEILFDGQDIAHVPLSQMQSIWGKHISLVPQNPLDSLNPSMRIGEQMAEVTMLHLGLSQKEALQTAIQALDTVKIADPEQVIRRYPHQLSGGMQQRVMIAMALSTRPKLLILDEPTTALDVTTQAVILDLVRDLIKEEQAAALYVSHDLGTVAQLCDYVTVLYAGEIMESASVADLFAKPLHPYTVGLLGSLPHVNQMERNSRLSTIEGVAPSLAERSHVCVFASRCPVAIDICRAEKPPLETIGDGRTVRCWRWQEIANGEIVPRNKPQGIVEEYSHKPKTDLVLTAQHISKHFGEYSLLDRLMGHDATYVQAVQDVSLEVGHSMTVGLVGESGSGKTTLARALVGLITADTGEMELRGTPLALELDKRDKEALSQLRMIFQNPNDALNPYQTVGQSIGRTYTVLSGQARSQAEVNERITEVLQAVGLTSAYATRYPNQLSGGEKQRVALARAFVANPALIIADEPTSSLDVSVQATILNLLKDLRAQKGASYLVISHNLDVIQYLADWIVVMYLGEIMEQGSSASVYEPPMHPYTEALLSAIPIPDPTARYGQIRLEGDIPSPRQKPTGCPFHTRCQRFLGDICVNEAPPLRTTADGNQILCHIPLDELTTLQSQTMAEGKH